MDMKEQNEHLIAINQWLIQAIEKRDRTIERLFSLLEKSSADTEQANQNCFILYSEIERLEDERTGGTA